jgi:hypothetical protein
MRFHLTMFFVTIAVSMGMHAMARAAEPAPGASAFHTQAPAVSPLAGR